MDELVHTSPMRHFGILIKNFLFCGFIGWCLECFWTGLASILQKKDKTLTCHTSIWMFPIYGMASFLAPISRLLKNQCAIIRGGVYTVLIFSTELLTGTILKKYKACPWDYSSSKYNYHGVIRFDYAPAWFFMGLLYERLLKKSQSKSNISEK